MREPFYFSGDCTIVEVSVDVSHFDPSGIPFCSIPSFTEPTMVPRSPQPVLPVVVPPDNCNCITLVGTAHLGKIRVSLDLPIIDTTINSISNCCDGQFSMQINPEIPCFPLSVDYHSTAHFANTVQPHIDLRFSRISTSVIVDPGFGGSGTVYDDQCRLEMSLDLAIPYISPSITCMAFSVVKSSTQRIGDRYSYNVDIRQTQKIVVVDDVTSWTECRISFNFDFMFPSIPVISCMAFEVRKSVAVKLTSVNHGTLDVSQTCFDVLDFFGGVIGRYGSMNLRLDIQYNVPFPVIGETGSVGDKGDPCVCDMACRCGVFLDQFKYANDYDPFRYVFLYPFNDYCLTDYKFRHTNFFGNINHKYDPVDFDHWLVYTVNSYTVVLINNPPDPAYYQEVFNASIRQRVLDFRKDHLITNRNGYEWLVMNANLNGLWKGSMP